MYICLCSEIRGEQTWLISKCDINVLQTLIDGDIDMSSIFELEKKIFELNVERRTKLKQQELYDTKLKELTEENLDLKQKITELKKEIKNGRKSV